jgi:The GLUG motif.
MVTKEQKNKERAGGKGHTSFPKITIILVAALMLTLCIAIPLADINNENNIVAGDHRAPVLGENEIHTYQELQSITDFTADYILMADIMCPSGVNFRPIGYDTDNTTVTAFTGSFDGNGFEISNMSISSFSNTNYYNYAGLFAQLDADAKVSNLGLINCSITIDSSWSYYVGGIVAYIPNTATGVEITNCYNTGPLSAITILSGGSNVGGIVGCVKGTTLITDCYNTSSVLTKNAMNDDDSYVGGIAGYIDGATIADCYNTGTVTTGEVCSNVYAGGIVGYVAGTNTIANCYNTGDVSTTMDTQNRYAGGIAGYVTGTNSITGCYNTGNVSTTTVSSLTYVFSYAGGIAGYVTGTNTVADCYNKGAITSTASTTASYVAVRAFAGGIVGSSQNYVADNLVLTNCYNTGDISATSEENAFAGGIAGPLYNATVTNCYNTGDISATSEENAFAGGITGYVGGGIVTITTCYIIGAMTASAATLYAEPIDGSGTAIVTDCYWLDTLGFPGGLPVGDMTGAGALSNMPGFSNTDWFANADGDFDEDHFATYFPQLTVFAGSSDPKIQTDSIVSVSILTDKINVAISQTGTYEYVQGDRLSALMPDEKPPAGIQGTFTWKNGNDIVTLSDTTKPMVFTPQNFRYKTVTFNAMISVIGGYDVPTITPTGIYTYVEGEKLHVNVPTEISPAGIPGTFAWLNGNDIVKMGDTSKPMMFTPYNANYSPATFNVPITVTKGPTTNVPSTPPTGGPTTVPTITQTGVYSYVQGEKIHANVPTEVTPAGIPGTFTWKNGNHVVTTRDTSAAMVFTPYDGRYDPVTFNVSITVNEAVPGSDNNSGSSDNGNDVMLTVLVGCLLSAVIGAVIAVVAGMIIRKH